MIQTESSKGYQLSFKVFRDDGLTREEKITSDSVTIGRATTNVISLDDEGVSDLHAVIKVTKDKKLVLTDLGSDEGTFVSGQRVDTRVQLEPGSRVRVGPFDIQFDLVDLNKLVASAAAALAAGQTDPLHDRTDAELDLSADQLIDLLFKAWDSHDKLGVDNRQAGKVLEVFEIWGDTILSANQFPKTTASIKLAEEHKDHPDFFVPAEYLPSSTCSLVTQVNGAMHLLFGRKYEGRLYQGGKEFTLEELIRTGLATPGTIPDQFKVPLTDDSRFVVKLGHIMLVGGFTYPAKKPLAAGSLDVDAPFMSLLLLIALVMGSVTIYMRTLPPPSEMDLTQIPDKFAQFILPKKEEKKREEEKKKKAEVSKATPTPAPEVEKKEDIKVGKKDTKAKLAKGDKVALDQAKLDKQIAENAGFLNDINKKGNLLGAGLDQNIINKSGLLATTGNSQAGFTTASTGIGFSGGGTAGGGIGGVGTRGGDGGTDDYTRKGVKKGGRETAGLVESGGDAIIIGALDKSLIDRVIREHIMQIKYCYNKELNKNPRLSGKVVVKFTIDKEGGVSASNIKETSMNNAGVESCVNSRILQLRFPEPKGGGIVIVSYPFIFGAAG